jgi:hypothetical protein
MWIDASVQLNGSIFEHGCLMLTLSGIYFLAVVGKCLDG